MIVPLSIVLFIVVIAATLYAGYGYETWSPKIVTQGGEKSEIDRHIESQLKAQGLKPTPVYLSAEAQWSAKRDEILAAKDAAYMHYRECIRKVEANKHLSASAYATQLREAQRQYDNTIDDLDRKLVQLSSELKSLHTAPHL